MQEAKAKSRKTQSPKIEAPMVQPPSRMERNQPKKPATLRVCGNTIPVTNGKAEEADPKVLRARRKAELKRRGLEADETRI